MKNPVKKFYFTVFFFISFLAAAPGVCAERMTADDLVYLTENFPPHNYLKNGRLVGASVEILELIWEKLDASKTRKDIRMVPWARGMKRLEKGPNVVLFGMGFSVDRIKKFNWVGPYYSHTIELIAKKENKLKIHHIEDAKVFRVGVVREDIGHQMLLNFKFNKDRIDLSSDIHILFNKFNYNRFKLICYVGNSYYKYLDQRKIDKSRYESVFQVSNTRSGFGFSKHVPEFLINNFQLALNSLIENKQIDPILIKYKLKQDIIHE